jgi:hypothetical protein
MNGVHMLKYLLGSVLLFSGIAYAEYHPGRSNAVPASAELQKFIVDDFTGVLYKSKCLTVWQLFGINKKVSLSDLQKKLTGDGNKFDLERVEKDGVVSYKATLDKANIEIFYSQASCVDAVDKRAQSDPSIPGVWFNDLDKKTCQKSVMAASVDDLILLYSQRGLGGYMKTATATPGTYSLINPSLGKTTTISESETSCKQFLAEALKTSAEVKKVSQGK